MAMNKIPQNLRGGLRRYVSKGIPPGGFLRSVLESKIPEAHFRAIGSSLPAIPDIIDYLKNDVPPECWGTPGKVKAWIKHRGQRGPKANTPKAGTLDSDLSPEQLVRRIGRRRRRRAKAERLRKGKEFRQKSRISGSGDGRDHNGCNPDGMATLYIDAEIERGPGAEPDWDALAEGGER